MFPGFSWCKSNCKSQMKQKLNMRPSLCDSRPPWTQLSWELATQSRNLPWSVGSFCEKPCRHFGESLNVINFFSKTISIVLWRNWRATATLNLYPQLRSLKTALQSILERQRKAGSLFVACGIARYHPMPASRHSFVRPALTSRTRNTQCSFLHFVQIPQTFANSPGNSMEIIT